MSRSGSTSTKCTDQRLNSRIATQSAHHHGAQEVQDVERGHPERLLIASPPALHTVVHESVLLRGGVKMFLGKHGGLLDIETQLE